MLLKPYLVEKIVDSETGEVIQENLSFANTNEGFNELLNLLKSLDNSKQIRIGFEATGHYGMNLKLFLEKNNYFGYDKSCVTLFSGLSGASKSTFTVSNVIYPIIKNGHKVLLISNELNFRQYMMMFLTIILTRELNYFKITRDKLNKAKLTDEDIAMIKQAQKIINEKYDKPIHFIDMNASSTQEVIRAIRKYSKIGYYLTVYDTAKPDSSISDASGQAWQRSLEMIKELTYVTQETKTHLWLPYQIANSSDYKRRLTRADLAEAKNIITMITNHGILRKIKPEEKDPESKYYCNPYKLTYNEDLGKWIKEKINKTTKIDTVQ